MRISLTQSDLNTALQVVQRAVSGKSILPVLSGVLFEMNGGKLNLCSTDLELSIRCGLDASGDAGEAAVLPARLVGDIVKNLADARVDIVVEGSGATARLTSGQSQFDIKTYPAEDFPKFPELAPEQSVAIAGEKLASAVKQVIKAVSRDETRPVLCGVLLTIEKGRLRLVATDSYRLAIHEAAVDGAPPHDVKAIIPARCMDELARVGAAGDVEMGLAKNQIYFKVGDVSVVSRLIEGNFPNYQQLLPEGCDLRVKMRRDELIAALKRVALLAQNNALVKMKIEPGKVQLTAMTADVGSAYEEVGAEVGGDGMEIAFNAQYLIDGLNSIAEDEVFLELNNPLKPGILRPAQAQDFLYLVMPVRIG